MSLTLLPLVLAFLQKSRSRTWLITSVHSWRRPIYSGSRSGHASFRHRRATSLSAEGKGARLDDVSGFLRAVAPPLDGNSHKGQAGRIGVLGGSIQYTGAPFYAGMSALRVGAELLYLFTATEAAGPIKTYSPELMVSSVYCHERIVEPATRALEQRHLIKSIVNILPRLHALCIGPGLGRDASVLAAVSDVIEAAKTSNVPLVVDADGLWLLTERPSLVYGCRNVVLTPNAMEYRRLAKAVLGDESASILDVSEAMDGPVIFRKGPEDLIHASGSAQAVQVGEAGAPKRPGGLGDILSGSIATVLAWAVMRNECRLQACQAASVLVRRACRRAFAKEKRAMVAPDVIAELGACFEELCPAEAE